MPFIIAPLHQFSKSKIKFYQHGRALTTSKESSVTSTIFSRLSSSIGTPFLRNRWSIATAMRSRSSTRPSSSPSSSPSSCLSSRASSLIFYREIVLWNGLPFRPSIPAGRPLSRDEMGTDVFDQRMATGLAQAQAGEGRPANAVFTELMGEIHHG